MDLNIEDEINEILNSITHSDLEELDDIQEIRTLAIDKVFNSYLVYQDNIKNKEQSIQKLENFKFIDINELQKGDFITYFNFRNFTDLKLVIGGSVISPNYKDSGDIIIGTSYGIKRIKPNIFFKRIPSDELVKMRLIQITHNL